MPIISFETRMQAYWGYCEQERGTYLETRKREKISSQTRASRMRSYIKRKDRENKGNKPRRDMEDSDSEESDFWMLKSSSGSESEEETDEGNCKGSHCHAKESEELSERTKRMSIQIGPSSFASRKKRSRMFLKIKN